MFSSIPDLYSLDACPSLSLLQIWQPKTVTIHCKLSTRGQNPLDSPIRSHSCPVWDSERLNSWPELRFQKTTGEVKFYLYSLGFFCLSITIKLTCAACLLSYFGRVWLFATLWAVAHQDPLSRGFSRQEYWSVLPCPLPGIKPTSYIFC